MGIDLLASMLKKSDEGSETIKASVCQNIKGLLESRQCLQLSPSWFPLSGVSLYGYGLSSRHFGRSHYQGNRLCREIEKLLENYEPRLQNVLVEMDRINEKSNLVNFTIEAMLVVDVGRKKICEPIMLDSTLNLTCARLTIEESSFV